MYIYIGTLIIIILNVNLLRIMEDRYFLYIETFLTICNLQFIYNLKRFCSIYSKCALLLSIMSVLECGVNGINAYLMCAKMNNTN